MASWPFFPSIHVYVWSFGFSRQIKNAFSKRGRKRSRYHLNSPAITELAHSMPQPSLGLRCNGLTRAGLLKGNSLVLRHPTRRLSAAHLLRGLPAIGPSSLLESEAAYSSWIRILIYRKYCADYTNFETGCQSIFRIQRVCFERFLVHPAWLLSKTLQFC